MIKERKFDVYNDRLMLRLSCNICRCYKFKGTDTGYTPECRPFDCYHYYHGECLESWKSFHLNKNKGVAKIIRCSLCKSNVRDKYEDLYACEWKINGAGVKLSSNARIEVIDIDDSDDVEVSSIPNIPNFKEQQEIEIARYKNLHRADQESYKEYMNNNKMTCAIPESKRQSLRISNRPDRYGQNTLTVKHLLIPNKFNISSAMSVVTMENNLLEVDINTSSKKKRKKIITENSEEIKSDSSKTKSKKTKPNADNNQPVEVCCYDNCLVLHNDLETCGTSNCYKKLHHSCQNNIDEAQFNGKFEDVFGLRYACYDCMAELMKKGLFP